MGSDLFEADGAGVSVSDGVVIGLIHRRFGVTDPRYEISPELLAVIVGDGRVVLDIIEDILNALRLEIECVQLYPSRGMGVQRYGRAGFVGVDLVPIGVHHCPADEYMLIVVSGDIAEQGRLIAGLTCIDILPTFIVCMIVVIDVVDVADAVYRHIFIHGQDVYPLVANRLIRKDVFHVGS